MIINVPLVSRSSGFQPVHEWLLPTYATRPRRGDPARPDRTSPEWRVNQTQLQPTEQEQHLYTSIRLRRWQWTVPPNDVPKMFIISTLEIGFLLGGANTPAFDPRILLLRAGDVERNPGPDCCSFCKKEFRNVMRPFECEEEGCEEKSHRDKKCSKVPRGRKEWRCRAHAPPVFFMQF